MWLFIQRKARRWLLVAVALPLIGRLMVAGADVLRDRRGESFTSRHLRQAGNLAWRRGTSRQSRPAS